MINISRLEPNVAERQKNLNALSGLAATKGACIHLVIADFQIASILGQEREADLGPSGVSPVGPDQERHIGEALTVDRLDGEEQIVGAFTLKIMHS